MPRVLVTGGTGGLGHEVVGRLIAAGTAVRILSRRARQPGEWPSAEWVQGDLATGAGLGAAVANVDTIVHAATSSFYRTFQIDVQGTRRLLEQARAAGVSHIIYISIVGIDQVPSYPYYGQKLAAEAIVRAAGIPWSIIRATQFHTLIDLFLHVVTHAPILLLPTDLLAQPIDTGEVAGYVCECIAAGPGGYLPDIGGPEILRLDSMTRAWLAARGKRRRIIHLPLPGKTAAGIRRGLLTCPDRPYGRVTWAEWLQRTYGQQARAPSSHSVTD